MSLDLLKSHSDWVSHRAAFLADNNINISWDENSNPRDFPCLVGTTVVQSSVVCMFVYPEDLRLLSSFLGDPPVQAKAPQPRPASATDVALTGLVKELIAVGILREQFFVESLNAAEADLDYHNNRLHETLISQFRGDPE
jgi:hypothetical protein